jgi:hypothetical protein
MRQLFIVAAAFLLFSCKKNKSTDEIVFIQQDTILSDSIINNLEKEAENTAQKVTVGTKIEGDFTGSNQPEHAEALKTKVAIGNPAEDGSPAEYTVVFGNKNLNPISAGCCEIQLVNEGDLNGDGADELSFFQAPANGCTFTMTTYTHKGGKWTKLFEPFGIPTACEEITQDDIQKRVFKEGGKVYIYETDVNDENFKLVKKEVEIE